MRTAAARLQQRGYVVVRRLLEARENAVVARALDRLTVRGAGSRNLLDRPWCRALVLRVRRRLAGSNVLPESFVAVQCTLFDKTADRNWLVPLHQDLSIPVRARVEHPSIGPWSKKEGGHFVQPPVEVLKNLVAARVHVDDCFAENGPLRVVPGSHRRGKLSAADAAELRSSLGEKECLAVKGDALLMRPLLLHASSKAKSPSRRRVLHVLFGPRELPNGLEWRHAV